MNRVFSLVGGELRWARRLKYTKLAIQADNNFCLRCRKWNKKHFFVAFEFNKFSGFFNFLSTRLSHVQRQILIPSCCCWGFWASARLTRRFTDLIYQKLKFHEINRSVDGRTRSVKKALNLHWIITFDWIWIGGNIKPFRGRWICLLECSVALLPAI